VAEGFHRRRLRWPGQPARNRRRRVRDRADRGREQLLHRPLLHAARTLRDSDYGHSGAAVGADGEARLTRRRLRVVVFALVVLALATIAPQLITGAYYQNLAILALLYAVVASNWDLTIGYAGLFNFAHIAFFGLGAYTTGVLTTKYTISPWLGIAAAVGLSVVVGAAVAFPATRLRGIYVALTTFAFTALVSALIV